jgi:hypothetical protein
MTAWNSVKRAIGFLVLVILSVTAGGCVRNAHAILKDDQVIADDALVGKWVSKDGKVSAELKAGANNQYKLVYTNEDAKSGAFLVRFGKLGDNLVAEVRADPMAPDANGEYQSLLLPLYTMIAIPKSSAEQLQLTAVSVDWLKKYVQDHPDELDVISVGGQDLIVNSPTEDYQRFVLRHWSDKDMLGEPSLFVHPGDPTTRPAVDDAHPAKP